MLSVSLIARRLAIIRAVLQIKVQIERWASKRAIFPFDINIQIHGNIGETR